MTMTNNNAVAQAARAWTSATWRDMPFVPAQPPGTTNAPNLSLLGQTWQWSAVRSEGRITRSGDILRVTCFDDDYVFDSDAPQDKVRAELARQPRCPNDGLIWYGFGVRFPENIWPISQSDWMIIMQTHQTGPIPGVVPGNPPLNLSVSKDAPGLQLVRNTQDPGDADNNIFEILHSFDITPGRWQTFVMRAQFSAGGTSGSGSIKAWLDGSVIYDTSTVPGWDGELAYDHDSDLGPKVGVYRSAPLARQTVVEFRNPEIGMGHGLLHPDYAGHG